MANSNYKFEGWVGEDEASAEGKMVWKDYEPKKFEETDVDIRITHCGICGSDIHVLRSGWVSYLCLPPPHLSMALSLSPLSAPLIHLPSHGPARKDRRGRH